MLNNFINPGLEDLCVSRTSFTWGVPVDFDPGHVVYVWVDALSNYITSLGYPDEDAELFKKYWPADLHLVGKEIVRFHTIIWPCMLMSLGVELPKQVFGHGWLIIDGGKISKSLGNYKDPRDYIASYGVDAVRYFLLREVPFGNDGSFSEEALIARTNADLVNTLGNLVNRTIAMSKKYFDSKVENPGVKESVDDALISYAKMLPNLVDTKMNALKANEALEDIFELLKRSNKYIDDTTPWILAKDEANNDRLKTVLYNLLESIRISTILLRAFIPGTCDRIFKMLNTKNTEFDTLEFGNLETDITLNEAEILFSRIEVKE
jgi:methionyl-tRNA synthetase